MPDFNGSYLFPGLVIFFITLCSSFYVFHEYSGDRPNRGMVASYIAAFYAVFIGHWATGIRAQTFVGPGGVAPVGLDYDWIIWAVVGLGFGICYVIVNYSERPASARSGIEMMTWILLGGTVGVAAYQLSVQSYLRLPHPDWIAVAAIGGIVGVGELVSRYRDEPAKAMFTLPALLYVGLNASAALMALAATSAANTDLGVGQAGTDGTLEVHWTPVIAAGLGAMAILRSALFMVRTQDGTDLQVGPGSLVQSLLEAADRSLDRVRAQQRAWTVARVMERLEILAEPTPNGTVAANASAEESRNGEESPRSRRVMGIRNPLVSTTTSRTLDRKAFAFVVDFAATALPDYCIALTQNMKDADEEAFVKQVGKLKHQPAISDRVRLLTIGLIAMNHVGAKVLDAAVSSLADDLRTLAQERKREVEQRLGATEAKTKEVAEVTREAADAAEADDASENVQTLTRRAAKLADEAAASAASTSRHVQAAVQEIVPGPAVPAPAVMAQLPEHQNGSARVADDDEPDGSSEGGRSRADDASGRPGGRGKIARPGRRSPEWRPLRGPWSMERHGTICTDLRAGLPDPGGRAVRPGAGAGRPVGVRPRTDRHHRREWPVHGREWIGPRRPVRPRDGGA